MRQARAQAELRDLEGARQRFLAKIRVDGEHWIWTGSIDSKGLHGWFRPDGARFNAMTAHRGAWLLWRGDLPGIGRIVAACQERTLCVRPEHLTDAAITSHRARSLLSARVMSPTGEHHYRAKLSAPQVRALVDLHETFDWTHDQLAAHFGIDSSNVSHILSGRTWREVTGRYKRRSNEAA